MAPIRPDMKQQLNLTYTLENITLADYSFLVYKLDAANEITESEEEDNVGAWPLGLEIAAALPYFNDFEAYTIDEWHWYQEGGAFKSKQRFRH